MQITLETTYVVATGPITLTVTVGEGQKSHTGVYDGDAEIKPTGNGVYPIGNGPGLTGHSVDVITTVQDTNPNTNNTSIRYSLDGGAKAATHDLSHAVDRDYGTIDYLVTVKFLA